MASMERVGHMTSRVLNANEVKQFGDNNVVIQARSVTQEGLSAIQFPERTLASESWTEQEGDSVELSVDALKTFTSDNQEADFVITSTRYKTLGELLSAFNTDEELNSHIMSVTVEEKNTLEQWNQRQLNQPLKLTFKSNRALDYQNESAECVFWDFKSNEGYGGWSTEGCRLIVEDSLRTQCECDHMTNFAVLVSHAPASGTHHKILGIITLIGCGVSIMCLSVTLFFFFLLWRQIKSQSSMVMVNLCIALILGNLFFLIGIESTENKTICQAVAVLIHYFYLAGFGLMAAQGVLLFLYLVVVFHIKGKNENLVILLFAWGIPAIIVGLTMGITKMEGYGREDFCWLTIDNGALWAFLGPIIVVIIMNIVILIISIRSITRPTKARKQSQKDYVKSTIWNMVVLLPILGITWLFGALAISSGTIVFQYLFAIFNSFQGLFIFLFHCLFNRRIREALTDRLAGSRYTPSLIRPLLKTKTTTSYSHSTPRSAKTQQFTLSSTSKSNSTTPSTALNPEESRNGSVTTE